MCSRMGSSNGGRADYWAARPSAPTPVFNQHAALAHAALSPGVSSRAAACSLRTVAFNVLLLM